MLPDAHVQATDMSWMAYSGLSAAAADLAESAVVWAVAAADFAALAADAADDTASSFWDL